MPRISDRSALHGSRLPLPSDVWEKLEPILRALENAWRRGERPNVGDFLQGKGGAALALLIELVHEDLEYRLRAGKPVRAAAYLELPRAGADATLALNLIIAEFERRHSQANSTRPRWQDYLLQRAKRTGLPCCAGFWSWTFNTAWGEASNRRRRNTSTVCPSMPRLSTASLAAFPRDRQHPRIRALAALRSSALLRRRQDASQST